MTTYEVRQRPATPYVGRTRTVTMETIAQVADEIPGLIEWLGARQDRARRR